MTNQQDGVPERVWLHTKSLFRPISEQGNFISYRTDIVPGEMTPYVPESLLTQAKALARAEAFEEAAMLVDDWTPTATAIAETLRAKAKAAHAEIPQEGKV